MAAHQWNPAERIGIGHIDINGRFDCVGLKADEKTKCNNPLGKDNRIEALNILRRMSTMDAYHDDFDEILRELAAVLLCTKSRHRERWMEKIVKEWKGLVKEFGAKEFARRGGDIVMGEASDTRQYLEDILAEAQERLGRWHLNN